LVYNESNFFPACKEESGVITYIIISVVSGIIFGVLDGLINANPLGRRLNEVYKPIAKTSINVPLGVIIDFVYGFAMAGIFLILYQSLPGEAGIVKGIIFAILAWFFRVVMPTASNWMMFKVPIRTLLYTLITGLVEMLILGIIYGFFLKPWI
jgi:hypothetical protein